MICRSVIWVARFEVKWGSFDYWSVLSGELGMLCFLSSGHYTGVYYWDAMWSVL
jgi:hypothetical protein